LIEYTDSIYHQLFENCVFTQPRPIADVHQYDAEFGDEQTNRETAVDTIKKLLEDDFAAGNAGDIEALLSIRTDEAVYIFKAQQPLFANDNRGTRCAG